jgi:hypothetical protein
MTWAICTGIAPQNQHLSPCHPKIFLLVPALNTVDCWLLRLELAFVQLSLSSVASALGRLRFLLEPEEAMADEFKVWLPFGGSMVGVVSKCQELPT